MKKYALAAFLFILLPLSICSAETVEYYDTTIDVHKDGGMHVYESMLYDFGSEQKHGIVRTIPLTQVPGGDGIVSIDDFIIADPTTGDSYQYEDDSDSSEAVYKIGDPDVLVTGQKTYDMTYEVTHELGYFSDFTELYWNVIGTDTPVPVKQASASITFPIGINPLSVKIYCGQKGEKQQCADYATSTVSGEDGMHPNVYITIKPEFLPLPPGYGVTVAVAFPRGGIATEPSAATLRMQALMHVLLNSLFFVPLPLTFLIFLPRIRRWRKWKRYQHTHSLIAQYDARGFTPAEAGIIYKEAYGEEEVASEITYLIAEGYVDAKKDDNDITFIKTNKSEADLKPHQQTLLLAIAGKTREELKTSLYGDITVFRKRLNEEI